MGRQVLRARQRRVRRSRAGTVRGLALIGFATAGLGFAVALAMPSLAAASPGTSANPAPTATATAPAPQPAPTTGTGADPTPTDSSPTPGDSSPAATPTSAPAPSATPSGPSGPSAPVAGDLVSHPRVRQLPLSGGQPAPDTYGGAIGSDVSAAQAGFVSVLRHPSAAFRAGHPAPARPGGGLVMPALRPVATGGGLTAAEIALMALGVVAFAAAGAVTLRARTRRHAAGASG
jgi:hypothetical protein